MCSADHHQREWVSKKMPTEYQFEHGWKDFKRFFFSSYLFFIHFIFALRKKIPIYFDFFDVKMKSDTRKLWNISREKEKYILSVCVFERWRERERERECVFERWKERGIERETERAVCVRERVGVCLWERERERGGRDGERGRGRKRERVGVCVCKDTKTIFFFSFIFFPFSQTRKNSHMNYTFSRSKWAKKYLVPFETVLWWTTKNIKQ